MVRVRRILWKDGEGTEGDIMRELCVHNQSIAIIQSGMVWKILQGRFELEGLYRSTPR